MASGNVDRHGQLAQGLSANHYGGSDSRRRISCKRVVPGVHNYRLVRVRDLQTPANQGSRRVGLESVLHTECPRPGGGRPSKISERFRRLERASHIAAAHGIDHRACRVDQHQVFDIFMATLATMTVGISQVVNQHHCDAIMSQQYPKIAYALVFNGETNCDLRNVGVAKEL